MKVTLRRGAIVLILAAGSLVSIPPAAARVAPAPAVILAEEAPAGGSSHEMLFKVINFAILVAALGYLLRKPAADFFAQRSASIRQALEEGRKALDAARAKLADMEQKLASLDKEIQELRMTAQNEMEAERKRLRQETAEEAVKIQQFAQTQMEAALRAAKAELKSYSAAEAIGQAREAIRRRLDDQGRRRLVGYFLADLRSKSSLN